jgi:membrane protein DedA with SNARE-associated domain
MSLSRFLVWSTLGTAGWTALLAGAGWTLGQRYKEVDHYLGPLSTAIIVLLGLWYLWRVFTWKPNS